MEGHPFGVRHRFHSSKGDERKGQALADFMVAHPIPDDSPLICDFLDEEIMFIKDEKPNGSCTSMVHHQLESCQGRRFHKSKQV